jgi:hypothetical protein
MQHEKNETTANQEPKRGALGTLAALLRGARRDTPMRQLSSYAPRWSVQRFGLRFGLAYELLRESRSLFRRIGEMHSRGVDERGWEMTWIRVVPVHLRDALLQARNEGTRSLRSLYPWATAFDVALYQQGFVAGALFQADNPRTAESQTSNP